MKSLPGLNGTLNDLVSLAAVRDLPKATRIRTVAEILEASVTGLSRVLGQPTDRMPSGLIWYRDASPGGQESRYRQMWPSAMGSQTPHSSPADQTQMGPELSPQEGQ